MKLIDPHKVSVKAAIASGDAFHAHAEKFWLLVQQHTGAADKAAAANIGELVASATSLALAIELYLKALLLALGQSTPMSHDLHDLFERIPKKTRLSIESDYDARRELERAEEASGVSVHVVREGGEPPSFQRPRGTQSMRLGPLLKRNSSAFITWRYLFAQGSTKPGAPLSYEYVRLGFAAEAIRAALILAQPNATAHRNAA